MRKKSFQIALSAVSCALATLFVALLGVNTSFAFLLGYVCGAVALMLPLSQQFWWGGAMAYLATGLLCLAFNGIPLFYKLFPFIAFFGLHPLVNAWQQKHRVNRWLAFAVKDVWFVGMLCGTWALFNAMTEVSLPFGWMYAWAYPALIVLGGIVFLFYDWLIFRAQRLVDYYVSKIQRGKNSPPPPAPPESDNTFGVFDELGGDQADQTDQTEKREERGDGEDRPQ